MATNVRIFLDFWNFQLNWNDRSGKALIDWNALAPALVAEAAVKLSIADCQNDGMRVYASVGPSDRKLRGWLDTYLDRQPGINVAIRQRKSKTKPIHCKYCDHEQHECPNCNRKYTKSPEKGVDSAIVTDLFSLAWEKSYDVAILVSGDADFVPAVEALQNKGLKIVNATWKGYGHQLAKTCWASFELDSHISNLRR